MVASIKYIIDKTNELISSGPNMKSTAELTGAIPALVSRSHYSVADVASLPPANENTGRFLYVEELGAYRFSDGLAWTNEFDTTLASNFLVGELLTWGCNNNGQLGDNSTVSRRSPGTTAGGGITWCQVSLGNIHSAAVKTDGTLWTWGSNSVGQLGDNSTVNRSSPGTTAGGGTTWCQVSGSLAHTSAVKTDGTLWTWGAGSNGRLGDNSTVSRSSPGTTAGGGTNWCQVSGGPQHTAAVKTDGTLWTWGCNNAGQLGTNSTVSRSSPGTTAGGGTDWCQVSSGGSHTAAVKTDGTLWTWGCNDAGRLGDNSTVNRSSPVTTAGGGTTWCQVSAASLFTTAAVKTDGTLWTWGYNAQGRLGDNSITSRRSPGTTAGGGTTWCQVSSGSSHTAAVKTDGTLWTWGVNTSGELGDNSIVNRSSPGTTAGGGTTWCQVSGGGSHTAAIRGLTKGF